jgi:phenylpropionate dioxygenase-like ring-hydroxylating dioxygenase large terminal subunit
MLAGLGLDRMTHKPQHDVWRHPMNWKIALSTYLENYHFKFLHATTVGPLVHPDTSLVKHYGRHAINIIAMASIGEHAGLDDAELRDKLAETGPFISIQFLFPNTIITAAANGPVISSHVVQVYPGARPDEQRTDFRFVAIEPPDEETAAFLKMKADVNAYAGEREDYETVQHTQASAATGLFPGLTFGANEALLTEAHRSWAGAAGREQPDRPPSYP